MPYPQDFIFFFQFNFPICNGLQFQHWVKWPWTCSFRTVLCYNSLNVFHWFFPSDVWLSVICLITTESCSGGFTVEKPWTFPCIAKGSKCTHSDTRPTENSSNSHRNLAINHLGWSQKCPMGGNELTLLHVFQTTEKHTESFLFSGGTASRWQSTQCPLAADCTPYPGKSAFWQLSSGIKLVGYMRKQIWKQG